MPRRKRLITRNPNIAVQDTKAFQRTRTSSDCETRGLKCRPLALHPQRKILVNLNIPAVDREGAALRICHVANFTGRGQRRIDVLTLCKVFAPDFVNTDSGFAVIDYLVLHKWPYICSTNPGLERERLSLVSIRKQMLCHRICNIRTGESSSLDKTMMTTC